MTRQPDREGCGSPRVGKATSIPSRTLVLVDIENLAGCFRLTRADTRQIARLVCDATSACGTQTIVASSRYNAPNVVFDWPHARFVGGRGPNAADIALISVIEGEGIEKRFDHVIIGSGDGIFAHSAAWLAARGRRVTALVGVGGLSRQLRLSCHDVLLLPDDLHNRGSFGPSADI